MEQLILLILIGVISLVNWLIQRSGEMREKRRREQAMREAEMRGDAPSADPSPAATTQAEDPTESMRRLMEALGLPTESEPPPVHRSDTPPPIPEPPPLVEQARQVEAERTEAAPSPKLSKSPRFHPVPTPDANYFPETTEVFVPKSPKRPVPPIRPYDQTPRVRRPAGRIGRLVRNPQSLRDGIILQAVLGNPKAL